MLTILTHSLIFFSLSSLIDSTILLYIFCFSTHENSTLHRARVLQLPYSSFSRNNRVLSERLFCVVNSSQLKLKAEHVSAAVAAKVDPWALSTATLHLDNFDERAKQRVEKLIESERAQSWKRAERQQQKEKKQEKNMIVPESESRLGSWSSREKRSRCRLIYSLKKKLKEYQPSSDNFLHAVPKCKEKNARLNLTIQLKTASWFLTKQPSTSVVYCDEFFVFLRACDSISIVCWTQLAFVVRLPERPAQFFARDTVRRRRRGANERRHYYREIILAEN